MKHSLCMAFGLMSALSTALAGCADLEPATDRTAIEDLSLPSLRVQRGKQQVLLGVTDDGHALVWDAGVVYATVLLPGAPRSRVAEAAQAPLTMTVGRVALVWTAQPYFGALAPSPLVAWTAFGGAKLATNSSWPPALSAIAAGSAISADGRELIFSANVSGDGASGDLVRASPDLSTVTSAIRSRSTALRCATAIAPPRPDSREGAPRARMSWSMHMSTVADAPAEHSAKPYVRNVWCIDDTDIR